MSELDFLTYLKDDKETSVIAMYLENIQDGRQFMRVLTEVTARKPVVIIKSGRTSIGQRATLSHTGSMAGSDAVYDAALKEAGALRVENIEEMFDLCKGLVNLPLPRNNRLLVVTNSGGPGVMTADKSELSGLLLEEPSEDVKVNLRCFLPSFASIRNPIDLTVEGTGQDYEQSLIQGLRDYDAAIALYIGTPYLSSQEVAQAVLNASEICQKPILSVLQVGHDIENSIVMLKDVGIPSYLSGERAAWVLSRMLEYSRYLTEERCKPEEEVPKAPLPGSANHLLEPEAMALLRDNGVNICDFRFVSKKEELLSSCHSIGYPVVIKVVSPEIIHKSDVGGVILNVKDDDAAFAAFDHMSSIASGLDFRGVVIYPMQEKSTEVILGLNRDVQFGPVVVFGLGGIYSEVLQDIAIRVAPVDKATAMDMIKSIRSYPILKGIRGQTGANLHTLAEMIVCLSQLPFLYPEISEVDLNPVFARETDSIVIDARIIKMEEKR